MFAIIKKLFNRKRKNMKTFLIVIDTTDAFTRANLPVGILNVVMIAANTPAEAKSEYLKPFAPMIQRKLQEALYAYDVEEMGGILTKMQAAGQWPCWAFMPINGGRPPKQSDAAPIQLTTNGSSTLSPNVGAPIPQSVPQPLNAANVSNNPRSFRSGEFQNEEKSLPPVAAIKDVEKLAMLRELGVGPIGSVSDEGHSPRINASTGRNHSLHQPTNPQLAPSSVNNSQAELLRSMGVNAPAGTTLNEDAAISDPAALDPSLTRIDQSDLAIPQVESEK
jgi:hypothetical protein